MGKLLNTSFLRYAIVGASGFAVDYTVFLLVLTGMKSGGMELFAEVAANGAGMLAGAVWCYLLNRTWSFRSKGRMTAEAARYAALLAFNTVVSSALLKWLCTRYGLEPWLVKIPLMGAVFLWNYFAARFLVFRNHK
ncbi:MAG TPA: GtrA family protein [Candidatus Acidoferrum sp.]|nr:GtrA family protein [Candidatus Acidoferrum sp.]